MRWKAWVLFVFFVGSSLVGAHLLQRYRQTEVQRAREERLGDLLSAYRDREFPEVVKLADALLEEAREFTKRPEVLGMKAEALSALGGRNAEQVWEEIAERYGELAVAGKALIYLATSALGRGERETARELYRRAMEEHRDSKWARAAVSSLARLDVGREEIGETPTPKPRRDTPTRKAPPRRPTVAKRKSPQKAFLAPKANEYNEYYRVQPGDRLYTIARERLVTVGFLQELNPGLGSQIRDGQRILVPKKGGVRIEIDLSERTLLLLSNREGTEEKEMARYPIGLPTIPERKAPGDYLTGPRLVRYEKRSDGTFGTLGSRWIELRKAAEPEKRTRVAIHGTHAPEALDTPADVNAIRLRNPDVNELFSVLVRDIPVKIKE